jgi:hypothetical protein
VYGAMSATQTGTKEVRLLRIIAHSPTRQLLRSAAVSMQWKPCSGRGKCNTLTGLCSCQTNFGTSDGAFPSSPPLGRASDA